MSRQTFVFVGVQARDADLMHLMEQTLGGTFTFEEGTDPYIRVGTVAVYVGEHDFDVLHLHEPMSALPDGLAEWRLVLRAGGAELEYDFNASGNSMDIPALLRRLGELGIAIKDLDTHQSSLEDIFVSLVSERARPQA